MKAKVWERTGIGGRRTFMKRPSKGKKTIWILSLIFDGWFIKVRIHNQK
jgi:hypothetical protein